jgi:hypothetical protein
VTAAGLASCSAVSGPAESKTVIRDKVPRAWLATVFISLGRFDTTLV